jgi:hypothetical protein
MPILGQAAKILEINCPQPDAFGACSISMKGGFQLSVIAPPFAGFVYLAAPICVLDHMDTKQLYRRALETNYMVTATRGTTLAIDPDANQLLVCVRFRLDMLTAEIFAKEVLSIGAVTEKLRETLPSVQGADESKNLSSLSILGMSV